MSNTTPSRGEIWRADLDPVRGHEQAGRRPVLIVSADFLNHGPAGIAILVPLTTRDRNNSLHVRIESDTTGLREVSFAKCEDVRSVSKERLTGRIGRASSSTLAAVEDRLRLLLGL